MPASYGQIDSPDVRSPTSTRTEVRSPTSTRTEVRSPTSTSTEATTRGNFTATVTGGAGAGATTVNIYATPPTDTGRAMYWQDHNTGDCGWLDPDTGEVGWFGSKLVKAVAHAATSVAKRVASVAVAPVKAAQSIASGKNVLKSVSQMVKTSLPNKAELKAVGKYAGTIPGIGTVVGMGANVVSGALEGKSLLNIAKGAALGAIPGGPLVQSVATTAVNVAQAGLQGRNLVKSARDEVLAAAISLAPGPVQSMLSATVKAALSGQNVLTAAQRSAVATALNAIPVGDARALLTKAVQGTSEMGALLGSTSGQFLGSIVSKAPGGAVASMMAHGATLAKGSNMPNLIAPGVIMSARPMLRAGVRVPFQTSIRPTSVSYAPAMRGQTVGHRALSERAKSYLKFATGRDVAGLSADGTWKVTAGDTGSGIAKALTGTASRWTELKAVNPKVMSRPAADVQKYGFPIYVGDIIHLPASWIKAAPVPSTPATPSLPTNPIIAPAGDLAAMAAARVQLTAWGSTDGKSSAGVTDYGTLGDIASLSWSARDKLQAAAFETWWTKSGLGTMQPDGEFTQLLVNNLAAWTERKAAGGTLPSPSAPAPSPSAPTPSAPAPSAPVPATPTTPAAPGGMSMLDAIKIEVTALGSGNPDTMRSAAAQVRAGGYPDLAEILEAAAAKIVPVQPSQPSQPSTPALPSLPSLPTQPSTPANPASPQPAPAAAKEPMSAQTKGLITTAAGVLGCVIGPAISRAMFGSSAPPPLPI